MSGKLNQAITAIKAGDTKAGKEILIEVLKAEPRNESAWLWLIQITKDKNKKIKYLERLLKINPDNEIAKKGMARLKSAELPSVDDIAPMSEPPAQVKDQPEQKDGCFQLLGQYMAGVLAIVFGCWFLIWITTPPAPSIPQLDDSTVPTIDVGSLPPYATYDDMVEGVMGKHLSQQLVEIRNNGEVDIEIVIKDSSDMRRVEMMRRVYALQYLAHKGNIPYVRAIFFSEDMRCSISMGLGKNAVPAFLPDEVPSDITQWFQYVVDQNYYADLDGQDRTLAAFAHDPKSKPFCENPKSLVFPNSRLN
jgi:hypothetical protein